MGIHRSLAPVAVASAAFHLFAVLFTTAPCLAQVSSIAQAERLDSAALLGQSYPLSPPDAGGMILEETVDPTTYRVGPNDVVAVAFWGAQNFSYSLRIDPQGRLYIPNIGFITTKGMTLAELEKRVGAQARAVYPRLSYGLILLKPRTFLVNVAGLVRSPEAYQATALTRVSVVITAAGGVLPGGSIRQIQVRRGEQRIVADLQPYYRGGDRTFNPYLLEGDVVFVAPADREVAIEGAVHRPGSYELTGAGTVEELFELAGGLASVASTVYPVVVLRRGEADRVSTINLEPPQAARTLDFRLERGDRVLVPSTGKSQRTVFVQGAVRGSTLGGANDQLAQAAAGTDNRVDTSSSLAREYSFEMPFFDGDTVSMAVERAGGLLPWADARNAVVERREGDQLRRLGFDGHALFVLRDFEQDPPLQAGDVVYVPSQRDSVMVTGPVYRPGVYQYSPRLSAVDYVRLAGGPTASGDLRHGRVITKDGASVSLETATSILPGDSIAVGSRALTMSEWVQIAVSVCSLMLSATAIVMSAR
ncbi:MAG: SLBB domain-containing protein [Pseudomonadota bacterium]